METISKEEKLRKERIKSKFYLLILVIVALLLVIFVFRSTDNFRPVILSDGKIPVHSLTVEMVFDVYGSIKDIDIDGNKYKWVSAFSVPRIKNIDNGEDFNNYIVLKISEEFVLNNYERIAEELSLEEANSKINVFISDNGIEADGISGDSEIYADSCFLENKLISCLFSWYSTGGAHPIDGRIAFNYDLAVNKEIKLEDIISDTEEVVSYLDKAQGLRSEEECEKYLDESCLGCSLEELRPQGFFFNNKRITILTTPHRLNSYCPDSFDFPFEKIKEGRLKSFLRTNNLKDENFGQ